MWYFTKLRKKAIDYWKNNKKKVIIVLILILIVIIINQILKNVPKKQSDEPYTSYKPNKTVQNDKIVPEKEEKQIVDIVDKYFNYCNNGEYENAYNLITAECKKAYYPTLESFKGYVNEVFEGKKKIYNIQSYSIVDNTYVYSIRILDDILASGTTDGYYYYEEKLILTEENGELKLSIGGFIEQTNPEVSVEDDYMKIEVVDKTVDYSSETYKIIVRNKTDDKYIVIADGKQKNEVKLNLGSKQYTPQNTIQYLVVKPGGFTVQEITFPKYYDDEAKSEGITFGAVRILNDYDYSTGTTEDMLNKAVKLYSTEIKF